jgi:hypothetical protein
MKSTWLPAFGIIFALANASWAAAPSQDASEIYIQANAAIKVDSPMAGDGVYPEFPAWSPDWQKLAAAAWNADGEARRIAHTAFAVTSARWPNDLTEVLRQLSPLRNLTNNLGDAALYADFQHDDSAAVEEIRDVLHMNALIADSPGIAPTIRNLISMGIEGVAIYDLNCISAHVALTNDPTNSHDLPIGVAKELIRQLVETRPWTDRARWSEEIGEAKSDPKAAANLIKLWWITQRDDAERLSAAIILACHIYKFDHNSWPRSLTDLVPAELSRVPIDPTGDGIQKIGYAIIRHGLPDGSDRPLVYFPGNGKDSLFISVDGPKFEQYSDGSNLPYDQQKRGGDFHDVTLWKPPDHYFGPTTQPFLPAD